MVTSQHINQILLTVEELLELALLLTSSVFGDLWVPVI